MASHTIRPYATDCHAGLEARGHGRYVQICNAGDAHADFS